MSERTDYGEDYLVEVPLIDGGGTAFLDTAPTIAAGDVKIRPDTVMVSGTREGGLHVNPDAYILGFDSLSEIPEPGDTLSENGGDGSAVVMFTIFDGGTDLATGDMSGFFIVKSVSGTWTNNAQIDISGGTANVATVDSTNHDIAATAGLFAFANNRAYFGITAEEMTCKTMSWEIKDATATEEWEDTAGIVETEGHPAAKHPAGARFAGIIGDPANDFVSATVVNLPQSGHADAHDWFGDAAVIPPATDDRINNLTIKFWDADDPDLFEIAQIEDWDADGGGVNEGQITLKGRGLVRETALDGATTLRYIIYEDYDVVTERIATGETGAGLTAQPWNTDWDPEVQSEVADALSAYDPPTKAELDAAQSSIEGTIPTASQIQAELEEDGASILDTLRDRLTSARAGYLDNLNVGGNVASQSDVQGITQAQRVRVLPPQLMERPDSGSLAYRIWIYAYNEQHQAEDLDSNPTVTAENNVGTDRSSNLGTVTKEGASTGIYYVDYTVSSGDAIEGLVFRVTATEGAVATEYAAASIVVDTTAVDFTAADRAKLDTLHDTRILGVLAAGTHQPQSGDAFARLGAPAGADVSADIAAVKSETASIVADTSELQGDLTDGGRIDLLIDQILADTNELQTDWVDGGRLDLLIDDIISKLPAATVDGLTPTQLWATVLASCAGRIVDKTANPMVIQNPDGTQTRISATPDRASVTLTFTGV